MSNTENTEKLYLVSFGNSRQYVLRETPEGEASALTRIEGELNAFLRKSFTDETFAYFTTPKVVEISAEHADQYADYARLDDKAIQDIKNVLEREVKDMQSNKQLNSDAPFANVNPAAADIPNILG